MAVRTKPTYRKPTLRLRSSLARVTADSKTISGKIFKDSMTN